ncbi:MAG: DUF1311 domain-containing protein [Nitrospinae bacterium]|nr:DUF1311 domain-containing protein [Nitrospinota bacterium]
MNKTTIVLCATVVLLLYSVTGTKSWAEDGEKDARAQTETNRWPRSDAKQARRELDAVYKKLMKKIRPESQAKLRSAQGAWLEYRKKQCEFNTLGTLGGRVHSIVESYCYADLARQQKKILLEQLECEEGDLSCGYQ